jgi:hypothetical protein
LENTFQLHCNTKTHFSSAVKEFLNEDYEGRLTEMLTLAYAAWSPDLNSLDFFLCGCMRSRLYKPKAKYQFVEGTDGTRKELGSCNGNTQR